MSTDYSHNTAGVSSFSVEDITHKPKRMQGDMIKLKQKEQSVVDTSPVEVSPDEPLKVITLERAISYYKRLSADEKNGKLYQATASWLEELLVTRTAKISDLMNKSNTEGDVVEAPEHKED